VACVTGQKCGDVGAERVLELVGAMAGRQSRLTVVLDAFLPPPALTYSGSQSQLATLRTRPQFHQRAVNGVLPTYLCSTTSYSFFI